MSSGKITSLVESLWLLVSRRQAHNILCDRTGYAIPEVTTVI
ncbi:MAG: hypothetical protein ACBR20_19910 [Microcoleus sp.]